VDDLLEALPRLDAPAPDLTGITYVRATDRSATEFTHRRASRRRDIHGSATCGFSMTGSCQRQHRAEGGKERPPIFPIDANTQKVIASRIAPFEYRSDLSGPKLSRAGYVAHKFLVEQENNGTMQSASPRPTRFHLCRRGHFLIFFFFFFHRSDNVWGHWSGTWPERSANLRGTR